MPASSESSQGGRRRIILQTSLYGLESKIRMLNAVADIVQELLASYSDILTRSCEKCDRLLDTDAQFPIVRTRKRTKASDGMRLTGWLATHSSCT